MALTARMPIEKIMILSTVGMFDFFLQNNLFTYFHFLLKEAAHA